MDGHYPRREEVGTGSEQVVVVTEIELSPMAMVCPGVDEA